MQSEASAFAYVYYGGYWSMFYIHIILLNCLCTEVNTSTLVLNWMVSAKVRCEYHFFMKSTTLHIRLIAWIRSLYLEWEQNNIEKGRIVQQHTRHLVQNLGYHFIQESNALYEGRLKIKQLMRSLKYWQLVECCWIMHF